MNDEIGVTETEPTEPAKTELLVEQSDLDKVFSFPVFGQIENVDKNTTEMLGELKRLNEFLIPTEEEMEQLQLQSEETTTEEGVLTEEPPVEEVTSEEPVTEEETELVIDYDPLLLEQLEVLNAHMVVSQELQEKQMVIGSETALMLVVTIVAVVALKAFVEQITKW